ncbi:DUF368 domain-containing protein [Nesterenkonia pannonica]|uniref:DUF368 domain-containing protein n=1 Tax=Nesterenkonia pannonica TaxID=1548602 RepID=UPI002164066E|nr:DUF368 domain-containing protein [Nesterenkonia pannonica]
MVSAGRALITGPRPDDPASTRRAAAGVHLRDVDWRVIIPVLIGMPVGLFGAVQLLSPAVETYPELTRAAFFGMVLASIAVPVRMVSRLALKHWLAGPPPQSSPGCWCPCLRPARHRPGGSFCPPQR